MRVLVTGSKGFIGRNLTVRLQEQGKYEILEIDRENSWESVVQALATADYVVHLAGINRPKTEDEFGAGNVGFTQRLCAELERQGRSLPILFSSSIQAILDNPYGRSKREAEEVIANYAQRTGAPAIIYRLPNVFGKWCRPNYNSVVATFCYNIARDLPITISDPNRELELAYIDDVVRAFLADMDLSERTGVYYREVPVTHKTTLAKLADTIRSFKESRRTLLVPDHADPFTHKLYATYLSYLDSEDFAYDLEQRIDARGALAEFIKSKHVGQIFVSRTKPGITRGNHYHHTKNEKFLVLSGEAIVRFRRIDDESVIEYSVRGEDFRVIDIPPGYTHSIQNVGDTELVTLFWANEIFDPENPDTYALPVIDE
ncbi:MAG: SDR family oxidoreductase [Trueperella sp.]|nr:SDR family oxidoreductase [Trueperella sp.]